MKDTRHGVRMMNAIATGHNTKILPSLIMNTNTEGEQCGERTIRRTNQDMELMTKQ